jgi:acetolactate synthase small subunit
VSVKRRLVVNARSGGDGLRRVCSTLRRRGFEIEALVYAAIAASGVSQITVDVRVEEARSHLVRPALLKVIDVLDVVEEV